MMNRKLKQALSDAFYAPPPTRKAAFLKQHRRRELGRWELIALQVRYIRWWVWLLSLVLSSFILMTATLSAAESTPWYIAALTPFLALLVITENGRAQLYQMDELELACRMSRRSVMLARMVALGLFHLVLFGLLTPLLAVWSTVEAVQAGVYLLTPYLLTSALGMELTRRIRGRECLVACGGAAVLVSAAGMLMLNRRLTMSWPEHFSLWVAVLILSAAAAGVEIAMNLSGTEELQ